LRRNHFLPASTRWPRERGNAAERASEFSGAGCARNQGRP